MAGDPIGGEAAASMTGGSSQIQLRPMGGIRWFLSRLIIPLAALGRDRRPAVRMGDALNVVNRVLIVLPLDERRRQHILRQVFHFKAGFPQWSLELLFLGGETPPGEGGFKGIGVLAAGRESVSLLGTPRKALVERLRGHSYDLAIDLSLTRHPFVPYLLNRIGVPLRLGVDDTGRLRQRLYNLFIRLKDPDDVMNRLVETIAPICQTGTA